MHEHKCSPICGHATGHQPAEVGDTTPPVILSRADFKCEASETVAKAFPDDGWYKFVDQAIEKVNEDQQLQKKGGIYLYAVEEGGKKYGTASVRWEADGGVYSMFVGERWEITAFVNAMLNVYGDRRPAMCR